ncbi:MAG: hypothetical protein ACRDZO_00460 [Egibacteraceae bacterium]
MSEPVHLEGEQVHRLVTEVSAVIEALARLQIGPGRLEAGKAWLFQGVAGTPTCEVATTASSSLMVAIAARSRSASGRQRVPRRLVVSR